MKNLELEHIEKNGNDELTYNLTFIDEKGNHYHGQVELEFCEEGCNKEE